MLVTSLPFRARMQPRVATRACVFLNSLTVIGGPRRPSSPRWVLHLANRAGAA